MAEDWDDYAPEYESKFEGVTGYYLPHFVEWVNPKRDLEVVDVGCGPGVVSMALLEHRARVTGVDVSAAMLERLRERARAAGHETRLKTVVASGEAIPLPDGGAHAAVSSFGIIYCPDVDAALAEMRRVTTRGGPLMITAWTTAANNGWNSLLPEGYEKTLGFEVPPRTNLRWASADELRGALTRAGWDLVRVDPLAGMPSTFPSPEAVRDAFDTPPSKDTLASLTAAQVDALKDFAVAQVRARFGDGSFELPREAWIARGRA